MATRVGPLKIRLYITW